jgi:ubiquinone/menaquinone biosynthesis C-methylase UbiE/uncharacterized protein YbaR (Trm112 family)
MVNPLVEILRCPLTRRPLRAMTEEELRKLNEGVLAMRVAFRDGTPLAEAVVEGLITDDGEYGYVIQDGIALMLEDSAIPLGANAVKLPVEVNKNSVMEFYNDKGWEELEEGVFGDTLFEDLRPVAREYVQLSHRRLTRYLTSGKFFIDVASGPVQYAEYLEYSEKSQYHVCVDFSLRGLRAARKRLGEKGLYVLGDITNLPFQSGTIDGGVSLHTIYHVQKVKQLTAFEELYRVLRPGATAVVVYSWGKYSVAMRLIKMIARIPRTLKRAAAKTIYRIIAPAKYRKIMELERRDKAEKGLIYFDPYPYSWMVSALTPRMRWRLRVWRFMSIEEMRAYLPENEMGEKILRFVYRMEEAFPRLTGRLGQYPAIVLEK